MSPLIRRPILEAHAHICFYCKGEAQCVDHIFPIARGGTDDLENLIAACNACNQAKKDKILDASLMDEAIAVARDIAARIGPSLPHVKNLGWRRKPVILPRSVWVEIEQFRKEERFATTMSAVRSLLVEAIKKFRLEEGKTKNAP